MTGRRITAVLLAAAAMLGLMLWLERGSLMAESEAVRRKEASYPESWRGGRA